EAPLLIAKIETEDGITNLDDILDLADGAMIARGDLALEVESVAIPRKSKEITEKCRLRGKPVIMATQMLESMRTNIEPSRPEATDVFNAVFDGADALMLTGETSTGKYPAHAIQKMCELAAGAEKYLHEREEPDSYISGYFRQLQSLKTRVVDWENRWTKIAEALGRAFANQEISDDDHAFLNAVGQIKQARLKQQSSTDRISHAACTMATDESVIALVVPTQSGRSARMLSRFRPQPWIIALPHSRLTARKLQIDWGVYVGDIVPIGTNKEVSWLMGMSQEVVERKLVGTGILDKGKTMIFTCGTPLGKVGTTNLVLRGEVGIPWVSQT
ncbi:MAG TPA: pyruvate kinase, partial [Longimicrobium sp.]|nr:pyruvate kinase [Longimicrobium sp.]